MFDFVNLCLADSLFTLTHLFVLVNKFFQFFCFSFLTRKTRNPLHFEADFSITLQFYYVKYFFNFRKKYS